jgi:hypothetical protein
MKGVRVIMETHILSDFYFKGGKSSVFRLIQKKEMQIKNERLTKMGHF